MAAAGRKENDMSNLYKRNGIFWARFQVAGREYRRSLRTRVRTDAKKRLESERTRVENEVLFGLAPDKTWQAAVVEWNQHGTSHIAAKTYRRYLASLKKMRPFFDGMHIREITVQAIREMVKQRRKQRVTTATISRDLTAMSSVLSYAIDEGWIDSNPTLAFRNKRFREKRNPIVLPEMESVKMAIEASPKRFGDAIEWALECGMREGEVFWLEHRQLTSVVTIIGKGNRMRAIPYTAKMREIAERQPQYLGSPYVFYHGDGETWKSPDSRFGDIKRRLARKRAQFVPFRFHDLRHLYAVTFLRERRGSIYDLQQLLGHESIKTTERYLEFLTPEEAMDAMRGPSQNMAQQLRFQNESAGNNG